MNSARSPFVQIWSWTRNKLQSLYDFEMMWIVYCRLLLCWMIFLLYRFPVCSRGQRVAGEWERLQHVQCMEPHLIMDKRASRIWVDDGNHIVFHQRLSKQLPQGLTSCVSRHRSSSLINADTHRHCAVRHADSGREQRVVVTRSFEISS